MDILYLLLPLSVLLVLGLIALFAWALHRGQFDDLEREGLRLMEAPDGPGPAASAARQAPAPGRSAADPSPEMPPD